MTAKRLGTFVAAAIIVTAMTPTSGLAQASGEWTLETGALAGYHSNFFFRGPGTVAPSTTMLNFYVSGEGEFRRSSGRYTVLFNAGAVRTGDIANGNHVSLLGGLEYRRGPNRITGEFFLLPNRVFDDEGDGVFFDTTGTEFEYRRVLAPGLWVRAKYTIERWRFDPVRRARDSTTHDLAGAARFPLGDRYGVRATFYYGVRNARADRFNFNTVGVSAALEARPIDRVQIFVRFKVRSRSYNDASPGIRNFMREDTVYDLITNIRWQVGERWGIRAENFFRHGSSTRLDRNYSGNRLLVGVFVAL